jgi:chlorite dismutase
MTITFHGGDTGRWRVHAQHTVKGDALPPAARVAVADTDSDAPTHPAWSLRGIVSNLRYTGKDERERLAARQEGLGRRQAKAAALIPIRKDPRWWALAQDERRAIIEEQSRHISIGLEYLPAIARRLHHSRDLGEPFDFLTWFEFAPEDEPRFEHMLARLRASAEWRYVDREVDLRLRLDD